jgi:hypothetical protein
MRRHMHDHDIGDDADRDRVEERGGPAHPEAGELPEHVDDNPHHRPSSLNRSLCLLAAAD